MFFVIIFGLILYGEAIAGHLIYGAEMIEFKNIYNSFFFLLTWLNLNFKTQDMFLVNPTATIIYFI